MTVKGILALFGATLAATSLYAEDALGFADTNGVERVIRGHVEAIRSVVLIPQIEGCVTKVCFAEGGLVKKGDVLYQLERERYQFQLDLCEAELAAATFTVKHTQREYDRMTAVDSRGITQVEVEAASLQYETAKSSELQAKASRDTAAFDLGKTRIISPIDGRIGASAVCPGSYVSPIHEPLAQIVQVDPIRVVFPVPVAEYVKYKRAKASLREAFGDVRLVLPDGVPYDHNGSVDFENNVINEREGTIYLGARFPNPDQLLLPNATVDVLIRKPVKRD